MIIPLLVLSFFATQLFGSDPLLHKIPVVIDLGSGTIKAGLAEEDAPTHVFPSLIGRPKHKGIIVGFSQKDVYVGDEAFAKRGVLTLTHVFDRNTEVTNWDAFEAILHHTFYNELRISPEEHPILLLVHPSTSDRTKDQLREMMFDTFQALAVYVDSTANTGLKFSGRTTGLVVDIGYSQATITPIYEGDAISDGIRYGPISGAELTVWMEKLLHTSQVMFEEARDIKETLAYVVMDFEASRDDVTQSFDYELQDGAMITLKDELFQCPEALFKPEMTGKNGKGIDSLIYETINGLSSDVQQAMWDNIVVIGGSTMFVGLAERLEVDLKEFAPSSFEVSFDPERKYAAWIGGSMQSSESSFGSSWILWDDWRMFSTGASSQAFLALSHYDNWLVKVLAFIGILASCTAFYRVAKAPSIYATVDGEAEI